MSFIEPPEPDSSSRFLFVSILEHLHKQLTELQPADARIVTANYCENPGPPSQQFKQKSHGRCHNKWLQLGEYTMKLLFIMPDIN